MIRTSIIRYAFSYKQRALTPTIYSAMIQQNINNQSLQQIMHNLYLYENNIQLFDYDYFQRITYKILDYQKKMTVSEIITVLKLGIKHNIKNQMIWKHLQAQLHRRLYNTMNPAFLAQQKQQQQGFKKVFQQLQAKSQDYFQILSTQFVEQMKKNQPEKQTNPIPASENPVATISSVPQKMKTKQITKLSYDLVQILIWYGCNNNNFIKLLLETQLHPTVLQKTPYALIRFAELLTYACQINMKQYETNKRKYTARSIKGVYKLQGAYLPELLKNLKGVLGNFNTDDIKYLTEVINSFPVKKRQHRRVAVDLISTQLKNRSADLLIQQKANLEQILAKDQKLIKKFRQAHNLIPQQKSTPEQNTDKNEKQKSQTKQKVQSEHKQQKQQKQQKQGKTN